MVRSAVTVSDLLREGTRTLREAGSESPGLDAEILLRESLGVSREQLFDVLPLPVRGHAAAHYRKLINRRAVGVPVAYITGRREFYGRDFMVNEHVLVPRPDTEYIIEFAIAWIAAHDERPKRIVDIGTGSGAIAVSVALETAGKHQVIASDVSPSALAVARENAKTLGANVEFVEGSLLSWLNEPVDLILANLPYLRLDQAHSGIEHEPPVALYAGGDGFSLNRTLLEQAPRLLNHPGAVIMELDPEQTQPALEIGRAQFPDASVVVKADLAGTNRYLIIEQD
jgi:release factor glutamine methyltransferase